MYITHTGPATATVRSPITYTILAAKNGTSAASVMTVQASAPAGVTFVSASSGCTNSAGTVTCTVGNLAAGASATITINVTAPATPGTVTNTAAVKGNETDPNTANNSASASTTIVASTDLSITKTAPATASTSSPITYTVVAKNNGPSAATGV